MIATSLKR